ncbi:hypothetical protein [Nonomuraea dietziae]|uniref:hypothetical protein n=1 Tax=Nonomuraea dietziae TaxID=65515 RepID=UPI0031E25E1F
MAGEERRSDSSQPPVAASATSVAPAVRSWAARPLASRAGGGVPLAGNRTGRAASGISSAKSSGSSPSSGATHGRSSRMISDAVRACSSGAAPGSGRAALAGCVSTGSVLITLPGRGGRRQAAGGICGGPALRSDLRLGSAGARARSRPARYGRCASRS